MDTSEHFIWQFLLYYCITAVTLSQFWLIFFLAKGYFHLIYDKFGKQTFNLLKEKHLDLVINTFIAPSMVTTNIYFQINKARQSHKNTQAVRIFLLLILLYLQATDCRVKPIKSSEPALLSDNLICIMLHFIALLQLSTLLL